MNLEKNTIQARLNRIAGEQKTVKLKDLFLSENRMLDMNDWFFDYSKTYLTSEIIQLLSEKLTALSFQEKRKNLLEGTYQNISEERKVFHTALRNPIGTVYEKEILGVWKKMEEISHNFRAGKLLGSTKKPLKYVVNIGIGGSYLGPKMVVEAWRDFDLLAKNFRFISNIDQFELQETLNDFPLEETLFIVASKSFTTLETLLNANFVREKYLSKNLYYTAHFYALSSNTERALEWGIDSTHILPFWDWVGGRFSVWGVIGLPISMAFGFDQFQQFLAGANEIDNHFATKSVEKNIPVLMALHTYWNTCYKNLLSEVIVPYSDRFRLLPEYMQQLQMESNGKNCTLEGKPIQDKTSPAIWGGVGSNVQHAFFQWLHQGNADATVEFIGFKDYQPNKFFANQPISNLLAQSKALAFGKSKTEFLKENNKDTKTSFKTFKGNTPNTILLFKGNTLKNMGRMIALYEHKTFTLGVLYQINSFDQWGVELGKVYAKDIFSKLETNAVDAQEPMKNLIHWWNKD